MNNVTCNLCGSTQTELVNEGPDLLLHIPGQFRLVRCRNCQLIYQNPQLSQAELVHHYPDAYEPYQRGVDATTFLLAKLNRRHEMARRCQRIERHVAQAGRVLDIGCATGLFLVAMRKRGWHVEGIELSPFAAEFCRTQHGLTVHTGTLDDTQFPAHSFDVVTMWDVLEHVADPKATLQEISRILKPNGLVVLSLPNPAAWEAKLFGAAWAGWDRPRHLYIFSEAVLAKYFAETHFKQIALESFSGFLAMTLLNFEFLLSSRGVDPQTWQRWRALLYNPLFRLLTHPCYRLIGKLNKLTVMTVFARVQK